MQNPMLLKKLLGLAILASLAAAGCGGASTPSISPEEAKQIVGEDPDYLPGPGAAGKKASKSR